MTHTDTFPRSSSSDDDWLVTSAGLVVSETTIANNNVTLWSLVTPKSVLEWVRSMVATRLSTSGQQWTQVFKQFNSGWVPWTILSLLGGAALSFSLP